MLERVRRRYAGEFRGGQIAEGAAGSREHDPPHGGLRPPVQTLEDGVVLTVDRDEPDAARACGLRVIGVTWGVGDREELRGADVLVERPAELRALLA